MARAATRREAATIRPPFCWQRTSVARRRRRRRRSGYVVDSSWVPLSEQEICRGYDDLAHCRLRAAQAPETRSSGLGAHAQLPPPRAGHFASSPRTGLVSGPSTNASHLLENGRAASAHLGLSTLVSSPRYFLLADWAGTAQGVQSGLLFLKKTVKSGLLFSP